MLGQDCTAWRVCPRGSGGVFWWFEEDGALLDSVIRESAYIRSVFEVLPVTEVVDFRGIGDGKDSVIAIFHSRIIIGPVAPLKAAAHHVA